MDGGVYFLKKLSTTKKRFTEFVFCNIIIVYIIIRTTK